MQRAQTAFATVTGTALLVWWASDAAGLLNATVASPDRSASHIAAEVLLGCALLFGAWLQQRKMRHGRLVLSGAFGGLTYASVNVMSDYAAQPVMLVVLALASVMGVLALVSLLRQAD